MKRLLKSGWFKIFLVVALLFLGYRACVSWYQTDFEHPRLNVMAGVTVKPLLDPSNFPPFDDIDPTMFDIAPDGSFVFKRGNQLIACNVSGDEPFGMSLLVEQPHLDSFVFDAGGSLLTVSGGVLGVVDNVNASAPQNSGQNSFRQTDAPLLALTTESNGIMAQFRGVPTRGRGGSYGGPVAGGGYRGGGSGSGGSSDDSTFGDWQFSHLFFKQPDVRVSEQAAALPPPPVDGQQVFEIPIPPVDKKKFPSPATDAMLLPAVGMRLARTDRPGEVLLIGGNNPAVNTDVNLLKGDGTAEWLTSGDVPITMAAAANGELYLAVGKVEGYDPANSVMVSFEIVHCTIGKSKEEWANLVLTTRSMPDEAPIQSIAVSEDGKTVYFSTSEKVYAIRGKIVVRVVDGIGGILRRWGDTLYLFNGKRQVLMSFKGI